MTDHLLAEIAHAFRSGHRPPPSGSKPPVEFLHDLLDDCHPDFRRGFLRFFSTDPVLGPGEPVPGCRCEGCIGLPDHPPLLQAPGWEREWEERVARARQVRLEAALVSVGSPAIRQGRRTVARCPLHDDTRPSLSVDLQRGVWFCHVCAEGGDVIDLIRRVRRCSFADAVRELAA